MPITLGKRQRRPEPNVVSKKFRNFTIFLNVLALVQVILYGVFSIGFDMFVDYIKTLDNRVCDNSMKTIEETEILDDCNDKGFSAAWALFTLSMFEIALCIVIDYYGLYELNIDVIYPWMMLSSLMAIGILLAQIVYCIVTAWWHYTGVILVVYCSLHFVVKLIGIKIAYSHITWIRKNNEGQASPNIEVTVTTASSKTSIADNKTQKSE